jgi:hypothetical protein
VIEVRLELVEGDRVVLDRHPGRDELLAVALLDMASQAQVLGRRPPQLAIPVHARAPDTVAKNEGAVAAIRSRDIGWTVADRDRFLGERLPQFAAHSVLELVRDARKLEVRRSVPRGPTFQRRPTGQRRGVLAMMAPVQP